MSHTKGKWELSTSSKTVIIGKNDYGEVLICQANWSDILRQEEMEANAKHICNCVNSHELMVEALETAFQTLDSIVAKNEYGKKILNKLQQALKSARGENT